MKKGPVLLFRVYLGDEILHSYMGIISSTIRRIPIQQPGWLMESKGPVFFLPLLKFF